MSTFFPAPAAPPVERRPRRKVRLRSLRSRTGAGQTWNPDNVVVFWFEVALLVAAVAAAGVGSIDGLLHYAAKLTGPGLEWTLPVAVDVFLVGTALATLSLRRRGATGAVALCAVITLLLVAFSAACNYWQKAAELGPDMDPADAALPWVKAAMPVLLLAAIEIVAALTSTRNRPAARAAKSKAKAKRRGTRKPATRTTPATGVSTPTVEVVS